MTKIKDANQIVNMANIIILKHSNACPFAQNNIIMMMIHSRVDYYKNVLFSLKKECNSSMNSHYQLFTRDL